ncbi:hypothetical protein [Pyxidicoccus sp. MSG2]|uniref:hypothetical protein n=1 Tax=Pyxidicoccus sp. MSG2 TaxID=2996790 RepID=UPI00226F19F7|nr:hypothetical protein [Pyxidicoccus sp. MSG2]MCY1020473.1 hypothetical protein [Pyxidicoccus sp. MSG2]
MRAYPLLALLLASSPAAAAVPTGCQEDYSSCKEDCAIEYGGSGRAIKKLTSCIAECQETLDHCANRHSSLKDLPPGVADDGERPSRRSEPARKKTKKSQEEDPFGDDEQAPKRSSRDDPYGDIPSSDSKGGTEKRESYRASEAPREREEVPPAPEPVPPRGASGSRATSGRANAEEMVTGSSSEGSKRGGYRASDVEPEPEKSLGLEDLEPLDAKPEPAPVAKSGGKSAPAKPAAEPVKSEPEKPAASASREEKDPLLDEEPAVLAAPPSRKPATTTKAPPKPTPTPQPKKDISDWDPNGD